MEMIYQGKHLDGTYWCEITHSKHSILQEMAEVYKRRGCKTWLNLYNENKWLLTVMELPKKDNSFWAVA